MSWTVELEREASIRLNRDKVRTILGRIASIAERNQRVGLVVEGVEVDEPQEVEDSYLYRARIRLDEGTARSPQKAQARFQRVLRLMAGKAERLGWRVTGDASPQVEEAPAPVIAARPRLQLPELTPKVMAGAFADIYERDHHIRIIHDAMRTYVSTEGKKASHVLLYGAPAAAKTSLFRKFKEFYEHGSDIEHVVFIDAHGMTRAGLEDWLFARAEENQLPEVIVLEEIEKQPASVLLPLLSVMGSGYLMKTNARVGRRMQETRLVVWATCNAEQELRKYHDGALWSRFTHKLECARPSRELMHQILRREVTERPGGREAWADAALSFGWDILRTNDPREIIGLLDGRDRLLTGEYQDDYLAVRGAGTNTRLAA